VLPFFSFLWLSCFLKILPHCLKLALLPFDIGTLFLKQIIDAADCIYLGEDIVAEQTLACFYFYDFSLAV
jgi:hypothetical protein